MTYPRINTNLFWTNDLQLKTQKNHLPNNQFTNKPVNQKSEEKQIPSKKGGIEVRR